MGLPAVGKVSSGTPRPLTPPTFRGRPLSSYAAGTQCTVLVIAIGAVIVFLAYAVALRSEVGLVYAVVYGGGGAVGIIARRRRRHAAAATLHANAASPTPGERRRARS